MLSRPFTNVASVRKAAVMTRVVQLLYGVLRKGIHVTKRDLFYTDVKLFVDQTESDAVLDDVAVTLGCTRTSLHVVASDKGIVVGRVTFRDDGDLIDCTRMGIGGKAIPPFIDRITDITVSGGGASMRWRCGANHRRGFACAALVAVGCGVHLAGGEGGGLHAHRRGQAVQPLPLHRHHRQGAAGRRDTVRPGRAWAFPRACSTTCPCSWHTQALPEEAEDDAADPCAGARGQRPLRCEPGADPAATCSPRRTRSRPPCTMQASRSSQST